MANVYDVAHELEKAIRESEDFKNLKKFHDAVNNDEASKRLFDSFRETQFDLQQKQMMGYDISEDDVQKAQQQFELIQQHELISQLMQAEEKMGLVVTELNKVIMKPLGELYGTPEGLN